MSHVINQASPPAHHQAPLGRQCGLADARLIIDGLIAHEVNLSHRVAEIA